MRDLSIAPDFSGEISKPVEPGDVD